MNDMQHIYQLILTKPVVDLLGGMKVLSFKYLRTAEKEGACYFPDGSIEIPTPDDRLYYRIMND